MTFKLGYSTYALGGVDPFTAIRKSREIGYEAIEICVKEEWPTAPVRFGSSEQKKLASLSQELGFPSPILFGSINVCATGDEQNAMLEDAKAKFVLAQNVHYDDTPILVTTTAGHGAPAWDTGKEQIRDSFLRLADVAAEYDAIIAIEAHAGTDFETPEKAAWIIEQTQHPNLKLDLDISHFYVEGAEVVHSVDLCAPHSVMVHIKDGYQGRGRHPLLPDRRRNDRHSTIPDGSPKQRNRGDAGLRRGEHAAIGATGLRPLVDRPVLLRRVGQGEESGRIDYPAGHDWPGRGQARNPAVVSRLTMGAPAV